MNRSAATRMRKKRKKVGRNEVVKDDLKMLFGQELFGFDVDVGRGDVWW